jgi:hypothetical protein
MILMASLLVSSALILPMSEGDKRAIRKELYTNYENDRINAATLSEVGLTVSEIIDRDIQILSEHKSVLLKKMDVYKARLVCDPVFDKVIAGFSGVIATFSCVMHAAGSEIITECTRDGKLNINTGNWFTDYLAYFQMPDTYAITATGHVFIKDQQMTRACQWVLPFYIMTIVGSGICLKKIFDIIAHPRQLRASLAKVKNCFDRDQAIIVQLKEIKHTLAI